MNKVKLFEQIVDEMKDLYRRKNSDYGDSFKKTHEEYGIIAFLVRAQDKINRLNSIRKKKGEVLVKDESVIDTLRDLANYSIMTIIEIKEEENAPLLEAISRVVPCTDDDPLIDKGENII
jgi:DNA primase large subunit